MLRIDLQKMPAVRAGATHETTLTELIIVGRHVSFFGFLSCLIMISEALQVLMITCNQ